MWSRTFIKKFKLLNKYGRIKYLRNFTGVLLNDLEIDKTAKLVSGDGCGVYVKNK